jgi:hypothetical protein
MKLINIEKLEDCLDGSMVFKYSVKEKIDETVMRRLAAGGRLQYYPDFPKPFFKIITADGLQVKGIIGDDNFEVLFPRSNKEERKKAFDAALESVPIQSA